MHGATPRGPQTPPKTSGKGKGGKTQAPKPEAGTPATSAPAEPKAGEPAAAPVAAAAVPPTTPVAPVVAGAPTINAPTGTAVPKKLSDADLRRNRVTGIVSLLLRGKPEGLAQLLAMGAKPAGLVRGINGEPPEILPKQRSELAKFLKEAPNVTIDEGPDKGTIVRPIQALVAAVEKYIQVSDREPQEGRPAFTGAAKRLAGDRPTTSTTNINKIRAMIEAESKARHEEFRKREDVQQFRAAFKAGGFSVFGGFGDPEGDKRELQKTVVGRNLAEAERLLNTDPVRSRELAVEAMGIFWNLFPKEAKRLFVADPAKGKTGGAGPRTKAPRKIASGTDSTEPGTELVGSGILAIFSEVFKRSLPRRDEIKRLERKEDAALRKESKEEGLVAPVFGSVEHQRQDVPGVQQVLAAVRGGAEPAVAASGVLRDITGAKRPKKENINKLLAAIPKESLEAALAARGAAPKAAAKVNRVGEEVAAAPTSFNPFNLNIAQPKNAAERASVKASHFPTGLSDIPEARTLQIADARKELQALWAKGRAGGGFVEGPLQRRIRLNREAKEKAYLVGEKRPETYESTSGHMEIVGENGPEIRTFPEAGKIRPNVPEWIRRGMAKDLTGRDTGGGVGAVRGFGGRAFRAFVPGEKEAIAGGLLTKATSTSVQRVFVVNWPPALTRPAAQSAPAGATAGAPFNMSQFATMLGQQFAKGPSGSGGGGGGKAPKAAKAASTKTPDIPLSPLEDVQLQAKRDDLITAERLRLKQTSAQLSADIRSAPTRGVQTATGEVSAINLGGLGKVIERRRLADEAATRATVALNRFAQAQEKLDTLRIKAATAQDPKKIQAYTKAIQEQEPAVGFLQKRYETLRDEQEKLSEGVISGADKLKVFGANTAGIIAGTFIFSGALTAAQTALGAVAQAAAPVIERMSGYANVTAKTTDALAEQTRQQGGNVEAVVAARNAQLGLSTQNAAYISSLLERRAATEAGNKSIVEQIDLFHTQEQLLRQNQGQFDKGLTQGTGGFFGTMLNATPSTSELLRDQLKIFPDARQRQNPPVRLQAQSAGGPQEGGRFISRMEADVSNENADAFNRNLATGAKRLEEFNSQAARGGETMVKLDMATAEQAEASGQLADTFDKDLGRVLREEQLQFKGAKTSDDILRYLQAQNTAATRPNADLLVQQAATRIIPNQLAAFEAEANDQLTKFIPAQRALSFITQPPTPYGAGIVQTPTGTNGALPTGPGPNLGGFGAKAPGVDPQATSSYNTFKGIATEALNAVIAKAREGKMALEAMGVPRGLIAEMENLGNVAQGLELGIANRNAAFEAAQYNRQMFILNRNLADALALTGKQVGAAGRLGALQREQFELSKQQNALQLQAQELALELQQRQINFQRAIAGITAPGLTPEERQARIDQAKIEADFAQKQLDIQKKLVGLGQRQFNVGVEIFDESARRQVQEVRMAIAELTQSHKLSLDNAAANQALDAVRQRQAQINQEIGAAIDKATKKAANAIGQALEIANASGEAFETILGQTAKAWGVFVSQGVRAINEMNAHAPGAERPLDTGPGAASGALFNTSGAQTMTVGEAGTETVAVLRNPRTANLMPSGDGGSGVTVVVDVHDNNLGSEGDMEKLVAKITRAVEESLNRKTALLGMKTAAF
jgi:hypothetical protein